MLSKDDMVPPNDPKALAVKIMSIVSDRYRLSDMSARCLSVAATYSAAALSAKRREFYTSVKALTSLHYESPLAQFSAEPTSIGC